jgi:hypothetical protein
MGKLRRSWAELPLEKKLGTVFVPLLIAVIGVGAPLLLGGGGKGNEKEPEPESKLETIDLAMIDGAPAGVPKAIQKIDLTVRNSGDLVSIVKRIGFRIRASALLRICQAGGGLEASEGYRVMLPPTPDPGRLVKAKVSQQIKPGDADRFTVGLDVPDPARQEGTRIYQMDVLLYHDAAPEPVRAGTVLAAAPYLPAKYYFWSGQVLSRAEAVRQPANRGFGPVIECLDTNEDNLKEMLAHGGERSASLSLALLHRG